MLGVVWFTAFESAEDIGLPVRRIALIEQKARGDGLAVVIHLESGQQIRVVESLEQVRDLIGSATEGRPAGGSGPAERTILPRSALVRRAT